VEAGFLLSYGPSYADHAHSGTPVHISRSARSWWLRNGSQPLSRRERQVFDALVADRPSKTIAFDLGICVRTVEVHCTRMFHRLGIQKLADAVRLAVLAEPRHELRH
jgi:FixJ family two-component response regulator